MGDPTQVYAVRFVYSSGHAELGLLLSSACFPRAQKLLKLGQTAHQELLGAFNSSTSELAVGGVIAYTKEITSSGKPTPERECFLRVLKSSRERPVSGGVSLDIERPSARPFTGKGHCLIHTESKGYTLTSRKS